MDLYKLGIKLFFKAPTAFNPRDVVPVFHRWIQDQKIDGHLLIDVHDYAHVSEGPGILLVAHEGNFSIDNTDGRWGLVYYRKQPLEGDGAQRLGAILATARSVAKLLETDAALKGVTVNRQELAVFANDRLLAPNTDEGRASLEPVVRSFAASAFQGAEVELALLSDDARDRLGFAVTSATGSF